MRNGLSGKLAWTEVDPEEPRLANAREQLADLDCDAADREFWPEELWGVVDRLGAPRWSLPLDHGGDTSSRPLAVQRYAQLAGASLTAAFILSQHDAAVRRLAAARGTEPAESWLRRVHERGSVATVGISHLTTSRRLGAQAIKVTELSSGTYRLDGTLPWVTAAGRADVIVAGAALDDGRQLLFALPAERDGVEVCSPFPLAALQASCTSQVKLRKVHVGDSDLLAGPAVGIMAQPGAVGTAGLETSALAAGQARAALVELVEMAPERDELEEPVELLCDGWHALWRRLMAQARGDLDAASSGQIRAQANALVLRATQAYLTARKGTGFLRTQPAQRWARQALFFLVWSCPAPIASAAIRDLAGLCPP
jgi:alkylation response protein AidB-like acyl-CoA dehydrogenase